MTNNALVPTSALDRLKKTAKRSSLDELVSAKTKRSLLLVDYSSSMRQHTKTGERKIDALRDVVDKLRSTHPVPMVAFGAAIDIVEKIPEPKGMTPLAEAIDFGAMQEANHLVVVTDGYPDSPNGAYDAADRFGNPIDTFYIGDGNDPGAAFCKELARRTGGQSDITDLTGEPKQLAGRIIALIGDGSEVL